MKKIYENPTLEVIDMVAEQLLEASNLDIKDSDATGVMSRQNDEDILQMVLGF